MEAIDPAIVECGVAVRARLGESGCGDVYVVIPRPDGVLVGAVDGLGHGDEAALAATAAKSCLEAHGHEPIETLLSSCHRTLRSTRGAVISVATFDASRNSMAWVGVGNVQGVLLRTSREGYREQTLLLRAGVVGSGVLPPTNAEVLPVTTGDTLILATDGIDRNFGRDLAAIQAPQHAADSILARYAKKEDDALVLVVRYRGREAKRAKTHGAPATTERRRLRRKFQESARSS